MVQVALGHEELLAEEVYILTYPHILTYALLSLVLLESFDMRQDTEVQVWVQ